MSSSACVLPEQSFNFVALPAFTLTFVDAWGSATLAPPVRSLISPVIVCWLVTHGHIARQRSAVHEKMPAACRHKGATGW